MKTESSIGISSTGGIGSIPSYFLRGFPKKYLKVTVDGMNIADHTATQAETYLQNITLDNIQKIEINITNSEVEALLLESNLIKKFEPKFNVLLKDDKSFSSIYISTNDDFPKMITHRGMKNKKGKYFGPFTSKGSINKTIETLQKVFLIRNCSDNIFNTRSRPCLQYLSLIHI